MRSFPHQKHQESIEIIAYGINNNKYWILARKKKKKHFSLNKDEVFIIKLARRKKKKKNWTDARVCLTGCAQQYNNLAVLRRVCIVHFFKQSILQIFNLPKEIRALVYIYKTWKRDQAGYECEVINYLWSISRCWNHAAAVVYSILCCTALHHQGKTSSPRQLQQQIQKSNK